MLFKDALTDEDLLWHFVKTETVAMFVKGVNTLLAMGYEVVGIVCDGRLGLLKAFGGIPVQICQFHQQKTVGTHLTSKPKTKAASELNGLSDMLAKTNKESFAGTLGEWYDKWNNYLNERTVEAGGKDTLHVQAVAQRLPEHQPQPAVPVHVVRPLGKWHPQHDKHHRRALLAT